MPSSFPGPITKNSFIPFYWSLSNILLARAKEKLKYLSFLADDSQQGDKVPQSTHILANRGLIFHYQGYLYIHGRARWKYQE